VIRLSAYRARFETLALVLLAAWEISVLLAAARTAPTDADWQRVRAELPSILKAGDLIVFAPHWMDPAGRKWLGDFMKLEDVARMDATRYTGIVEVSSRGAAAAEANGAVRPSLDLRFGALRLRRVERRAPIVTWDLRERSSLRDIGYAPHLCVPLAVGAAASSPARLDFPAATLGTRLVVYAGITGVRLGRVAVAVRALVDGVEATRNLIEANAAWVALPDAVTSPGPHVVSFEAASAAEPSDPSRAGFEVCIAAEARSPQEGV
jgi:hypothetical protein